jgi:hypothetical protein
MRIDELLKVYRTLWSEFQKICNAAGAVVKPSDGSSIQIDESATNAKQIVIDALCHFPEWRYKPSVASGRIQILVQSREIYQRAKDQISRSNVQVLYLQPSMKDTAQSLLALHYDFELPVPGAHPVFHAQFGIGDFPAEKLRAIGFRSSITPPPKETLYSCVRIPTPCMNFASVLVGLAADHLAPEVFEQILKLVRASQLASWEAECTSLKASLKGGSYLPSHHWY